MLHLIVTGDYIFSVPHFIFGWDDKVIIHGLATMWSKSPTLLNSMCHSLAIQSYLFFSRSIHIGMTLAHYVNASEWCFCFGVVVWCFVVCLTNFIQTSMMSGHPGLMQFIVSWLLRESHRITILTPLFSTTPTILENLQDVRWCLCCSSSWFLLYYSWSDSSISRMGVLGHLDKWFRVWTLRLWCVNLTFPADEKVRCHFERRLGKLSVICIRRCLTFVEIGNLDFNSMLKQQMKVLEEREGSV